MQISQKLVHDVQEVKNSIKHSQVSVAMTNVTLPKTDLTSSLVNQPCPYALEWLLAILDLQFEQGGVWKQG